MEPELRETTVRAALDADYRSGERTLHCFFHLILKTMSIEERNARKSSQKYKQQVGACVDVFG